MRIYVASTNPDKVSAVKIAFCDAEVIGIECASQVSEQPFDEETIRGAENRLVALKTQVPDNWDLLVAIENGLFHALVETPVDSLDWQYPNWNPNAKKHFCPWRRADAQHHHIYYDDCFILISTRNKLFKLKCYFSNPSVVEVSEYVYNLLKIKREPIGDYYRKSIYVSNSDSDTLVLNCHFKEEEHEEIRIKKNNERQRSYANTRIIGRNFNHFHNFHDNIILRPPKILKSYTNTNWDWHHFFHVKEKTRRELMAEKISTCVPQILDNLTSIKKGFVPPIPIGAMERIRSILKNF